MDTTSYWTAPRPPRERFDNIFALWARAGALFFEGFDYVFGIMLIVGVPAAAVTLVVEIALAPMSDKALGSLLTIPVDAAVSSFFYAWISGPIYYGISMRLQDGSWPGVMRGLRFIVPRWRRLAGVLFRPRCCSRSACSPSSSPASICSSSFRSPTPRSSSSRIRRPSTAPGIYPATLRLNIFLSVSLFLLASMLFTFGVDFDALRQMPLLAFGRDWSLLLLLATFPSIVTALSTAGSAPTKTPPPSPAWTRSGRAGPIPCRPASRRQTGPLGPGRGHPGNRLPVCCPAVPRSRGRRRAREAHHPKLR